MCGGRSLLTFAFSLQATEASLKVCTIFSLFVFCSFLSFWSYRFGFHLSVSFVLTLDPSHLHKLCISPLLQNLFRRILTPNPQLPMISCRVTYMITSFMYRIVSFDYLKATVYEVTVESLFSTCADFLIIIMEYQASGLRSEIIQLGLDSTYKWLSKVDLTPCYLIGSGLYYVLLYLRDHCFSFMTSLHSQFHSVRHRNNPSITTNPYDHSSASSIRSNGVQPYV